MSKPEFSKPFNLEHAKAGAPFAGEHGEAVRVLIWDRKHPTHPIIAVEVDGDQEAVAFRIDGTTDYGHPSVVQRLVMLPLGFIDGKPIFASEVERRHAIVHIERERKMIRAGIEQGWREAYLMFSEPPPPHVERRVPSAMPRSDTDVDELIASVTGAKDAKEGAQ